MQKYKFMPRYMDGVFAVDKPTGVSSAKFIASIQTLLTKSSAFRRDMDSARNKRRADLASSRWSEEKINKAVQKLKVKIGHGGTLDPLASGVLVIGVGNGTKKLQKYLNECTKEYEAKALFGISTTTGDCEGEIITKNAIEHITKDMVLAAPEKFVGDLKQTPPIFSAIKIQGKPLYEYARQGLPLPVDSIKVREVKVHSMVVNEDDLLSTDHEYVKKESELDENGVPKEHGLINNPTLNDAPLFYSKEYMEAHPDEEMPHPKPLEEDTLPEKLPMVHFTASVSSGTYIRSLISDVGKSVNSSAYMVALIRTKQSAWTLGESTFELKDFEGDDRVWGPVLKKVLDSEPGTVNVKEEMKKQEGVLKELEGQGDSKEEPKEEVKEEEEVEAQEDAKESTETEKVIPQKREHED